MAEVLNRLLQEVTEMGMFRGVLMGAGQLHVTHLQFADDTLIFCGANEQYLHDIKRILLSYQSFPGLAVNYNKSGLIVLGKNESWAQSVADSLECSLVQLPITYLGVPLGANIRKFSSWQSILDKIQQRLSSWKGSCLSRTGRLVLIKVVLNDLPVHYLSLCS